MFNQALGIDIGGTKIASALINKNGEIISEVKKTPTPKTAKEIKETLKEIINSYSDFAFIALATAGTVNKENTKVIGSTANLPQGYRDIEFNELSDKKILIENDANCAAIAEHFIGSAKGTMNSITLTLGTGVGGGIIVDGRLLKGKNGAAGEMHFVMERTPKRSCTCGQFDCYEAYASGNGLRKTGIEVTKNENISTYDIIDGIKNNDKQCILAHKIWQDDIALGIVGLVNIFDPDCVILSGSMEQFVDSDYVENFVNSKIVTTPTKIYHAKCKNNSGIIGAVLLGYDKFYSN